ncbi:hypothetical protein VEE17_43290 (plasmid) [Escherichia coli]|nr:hypothetical protein VEE17_43290 [Escherichia coli]
MFQLTYRYEARKPGVKDQITEMAFNGAGVRDNARTLKIGGNDSNLLIVFYVQIMPDDFVMQLHRF